jgi:large subunit ribosomal protein L24
MKKEFSTKWKASKQPRKQRKYKANASLHIKKKFVSVNLSKELRKKYQKRNIPVKKGDKVKILRGKYKLKQGKIIGVKLKISKVTIEGIQVKKQDGSKVDVKLQPSNLQIIELNLEDQKRKAALEKNLKKTNLKVEKNKKDSEQNSKKESKTKKVSTKKENKK